MGWIRGEIFPSVMAQIVHSCFFLRTHQHQHDRINIVYDLSVTVYLIIYQSLLIPVSMAIHFILKDLY